MPHCKAGINSRQRTSLGRTGAATVTQLSRLDESVATAFPAVHITRSCDLIESPFMRRPIASLLLLLFLAGLCVPVMQAQPHAPACCRRGGQHHCDTGAAPPTLDGFRSLASCCLYRHPQALRTHANSALGITAASYFAPVVSRELVAPPDATGMHNPAVANLQRGPPLS
jgi:hypothetical protein